MYYKLTKLHLPQNVTAVDNILIPAGWTENRNNSLYWRAEPQRRLFWKQEPRKLKNTQGKLLCIFLFHLLQNYEIWNFLAIYFSVYSNTPLRSFFSMSTPRTFDYLQDKLTKGTSDWLQSGIRILNEINCKNHCLLLALTGLQYIEILWNKIR